jgi:hypothetical protein
MTGSKDTLAEDDAAVGGCRYLERSGTAPPALRESPPRLGGPPACGVG